MCGPGNAQPARSVVWITAVEDADLYIDYKNSGNTTKMAVKRLQSVKITDPVDKDMSGAMIFATVPNGTPSSKPVNSKCYYIDYLQIVSKCWLTSLVPF